MECYSEKIVAIFVAVARTSNDLLRYHGKMMVIDGKQLYRSDI